MTEPADVDALRAKLKALGYLDAGVDRFVLAPARAGRGRWSIALRASLRIGVLAGLLLGVSGGIAAAARLPGLVTGVRDSVVLAAMLSVAFGTAAFLLTVVVLSVTARLLHRTGARGVAGPGARRGATLAGALVGAGSLAYLTLWWGATSGDAVPQATPATAAAIGVAVVISVLLGHSTSTIVQALLAAEAPAGAAPRRRLSLRASVAIAVLGALASAGLLAWRAPAAGDQPAAPPSLTVVPTGLTLTVVAIDGFDPDVFTTLGLEAEAPVLARLLRGVSLAASEDTNPTRDAGGQALADPARRWTTLATGQLPADHGVRWIELRRVAGLGGVMGASDEGWTRPITAATDLLRLTRPSVATGTTRRAPTFWEVAAVAGLKTLAVNWWATWPALPADGGVLTERAVLRLERGGALEGEITPPALYDDLRPGWPAIDAQARAWVDRRLADSPDPIDRARREATLVDAQQVAMADAVATPDLDLLTVYLPGLDIASHRVLGEGSVGSPGETARRLQAMRAVYLLLEDLLAVLDRPGRLLVLAASRGRFVAHDDVRVAVGAAPAAAPAAGQGLRDIDLAPTLLHALGLPVSRRLAGTPRPALLPAVAAGQAVRTVETYPPRRVAPARGTHPAGLEDEMRERLRSLGYVQ